jgi:outer membrane protein, multidrug efflux system
MTARRLAHVILASCLTGCVGLPARLTPPALAQEAPFEQQLGGGSWPTTTWWQRYQDPVLDRLVEMAEAGSPTLVTAHARYDNALQSVRLAAAASGAQLSANGSYSRQRLSDNSFIPSQLLGFSWYNQADLGLQASYTFDWWGRQRAQVQAAMDAARAAQAERGAAVSMLTSAVVDGYLGWQADQNRLVLARERERLLAEAAAVTAARIDAQLEPADSLDQAELEQRAARQQIAVLEGSASLRVVLLAALLGRSPAELPALTMRELPGSAGALPDNVKLDLIARRADVAASRWRVEAAQKNVVAARAAFFPDISVNALAGLSSIDLGKLLEYGSRVPQIGAAIHLPIFDSGRLKAEYGAAQAGVDAAIADYQDTLISAARDVATQAATRAELDAQRIERTAAVTAAARLLRSAAARVEQGLADARLRLSATGTWLEQRDALLQLDAAALAADVALQRALGGGFGTTPKLTAADPQATDKKAQTP